MAGPAIADGAVAVAGGKIRAVGRWRDLVGRKAGRRGAIDLGEVILLPGLVNAHCHLDYTHMAGHFPPPKHFTDWLKLITEAKAGWGLSDYAASWAEGAAMLVRTGTTTVGDIEAVPALLPKAWETTPLRVISFLEMIGITGRRSAREILDESLEVISRLPRGHCQGALSPHAPYSTLPDLLRIAGRTAARRGWPISVHVAESAVEYEMFRLGGGPMHEWMRRSGRDMGDCNGRTPVQHLAKCGLLSERLLAIHANYLGPGDSALLGRHRVSVVHCPRSRVYFGHGPFPLRRLTRAGVNVCLGTDSLASVYRSRKQALELSLFVEMQTLAACEPGVSARALLRMATVNGARALGLAGRMGELVPGACADLVMVPFAGRLADAYEAVVSHAGPVAGSMIGGAWALPPQTLQRGEA